MAGTGGSWGRHGWPRKNEGYRLYKDKDKSYFLLDPTRHVGQGGNYDGVANAFPGPEPSLGATVIGYDYTYRRGCKRVQWSELPAEWQEAFRGWLSVAPEVIRGFWLVGEQPRVVVERWAFTEEEVEAEDPTVFKRDDLCVAYPDGMPALYVDRTGEPTEDDYFDGSSGRPTEEEKEAARGEEDLFHYDAETGQAVMPCVWRDVAVGDGGECLGFFVP